MNNSGFTLIEMVAVLLLVGILGATATGKFIDLWSDAERAAVANIGANFTTGVNYVHFKWLASGSPGAVLDFMPVTSATGSGALSVNAHGWPAVMPIVLMFGYLSFYLDLQYQTLQALPITRQYTMVPMAAPTPFKKIPNLTFSSIQSQDR